MASSNESANDDLQCPVMTAWHGSQIVMTRMMQGQVVHLPPQTQKIKREHLSENVDLLGPLLNHLGYLAYLLCTI